MTRFLCYTSPARGHLYPTVPILLEAMRRGHEVHVRTLACEVPAMRRLGMAAQPIAPAIEAIAHDDFLGRSPLSALERAVRVFVARAEHELEDARAAINEVRPDVVLVDFNTWGAAAVAEASGLPWAMFMPYFLPWRLPGVPPFGPGLTPRRGWVGRVRDALVGAIVFRVIDRSRASVNSLRARAGLGPIGHMADYGRQAPALLYYTAEPFEYPCPERPANVRFLGPGLWEPPSDPPVWLADVDRPLVVVTCSTEFQDDARLVATALEALADEDVFIVATTAGVDPSGFRPPSNARVERFVAHSHLLPRAAAVVCHGGMGITQKALAAGVPTCVVPFGRDQLEVARHVEVAGAGVRLAPGRLTPARLRAAVAQTRARRSGAERVAAAFRATGGPSAGADALEALLGSQEPEPGLSGGMVEVDPSAGDAVGGPHAERRRPEPSARGQAAGGP